MRQTLELYELFPSSRYVSLRDYDILSFLRYYMKEIAGVS